MKNTDVEWGHARMHGERVVGAPEGHRTQVVSIELTHLATGASVVSAPMRRFSRAYWAKRNELFEQLSQTVEGAKK